MSIKFTQYRLPHGQREEVFWNNFPEDIEVKAQELIRNGYHFDIEVLMSGVVSATCEKDDLDNPVVAIELSQNDPGLEAKLNRLVESAHAKLKGDATNASHKTI